MHDFHSLSYIRNKYDLIESTTRDAVFPSQRFGAILFPDLTSRTESIFDCILSKVQSWFVPWLIVMGLSVLGRSVRQGIPRYVVSSWSPPESVMAILQLKTRFMKLI